MNILAKVPLICLCASGASAQEAPRIAPAELAPASEEDARVRDLLGQADRVKLAVEALGIDENGMGVSVVKDVATVAPGDFREALNKLRRRPYKDNGFGTGTNPVLYFSFFNGEQKLGLLSLGYSDLAAEHVMTGSGYMSKENTRDLNPEAVLPLRLWVSAHPQLQKILLRMGTMQPYLRPGLRQPSVKK